MGSTAADQLTRRILAGMGLQVAEAKTDICWVGDGFEFLGFRITGRSVQPRPAALERFKNRVRAATRRQAPMSLARMIENLNPLLRGWGSYFAVGTVAHLYVDLDKWIRTRLRSKVRGSKARQISNRKMPNRVLAGYGLVSLVELRQARLSPA
ncbi:maturase [Acidimicrobiaceae bacterium USS-CC1]|uniref:Maturase n=1 Tax=Acidiferrimicrobium australe TaxID=2664430 RepID=A0ABW9QZS3_9ACTN|nr:maturase [Acidiferrimicrobium australe]